MSTVLRNNVRTICVVAACGFCLFLSACSDNKGQDTPPASQGANQTGTGQSAESQSPPQTTPLNAGQPLPATDGSKCDALLTAKCTECHSTARICEKVGKKSKARWQRSLERMTARGAKLNAEETTALLSCLDSGTTELQSSCR